MPEPIFCACALLAICYGLNVYLLKQKRRPAANGKTDHGLPHKRQTQSMSAGRSAQIATLNDRFRSACGAGEPPIAGRYAMTSGVAALEPQFQSAALQQVRSFDSFTDENDPYGEHDFGGFELEDAGERLFWKIDYYADQQMVMGAEDPSDADASYRVLTLMLASEY